MKYLILIYSNPTKWSHPMFLNPRETIWEEERTRMSDELNTLLAEITSSGELLGSEPLADPATSKIVRLRDGIPVARDGPFAETREQLAGYFLLECESPERAVEIAGRFPDIRFNPVEVRSVMHLTGLEM